MRSRRLVWLTLLAVAALALVATTACGDDEEEAEATPTTAAGAAASPTPPAAATPEAAPEVVEISAIPTLRFDRDSIEVEAGTEVTLRFINDEPGVPHNWAAYTDDSATELIPGAITEICTGPCEGEITFTAPSEPGEHFFRCDVHPTTMTGTFVVR
jgi:plastocyanin